MIFFIIEAKIRRLNREPDVILACLDLRQGSLSKLFEMYSRATNSNHELYFVHARLYLYNFPRHRWDSIRFLMRLSL